ncbi:HNH endonuclease [Nocardioides sp. B-3]|nr:HNH endonuclease [Nocardioides sp. B-3]UUZ59147.1 HNH endonuclease [Nocardioides sp. B-3]
MEHDLSVAEWSALREAWGGCAYCRATDKPLQKDCVLPISRGGRYTLDNIAPACGSCNASKCNDEVTGWLRRKRLDERAFPGPPRRDQHRPRAAVLICGSAVDQMFLN